MAVYPIQATFNKGELDPRLRSRFDIEHYQNGAAEIENWLVMRAGGLTRRPGSMYIDVVHDHAAKSRLIPFIFSVIQAYMLEFADELFRVFMDGGIVESAPDTPVEVVTPWATADLFGLHYTQSNDVLYVAHKDYAPRKITRTGHTTWTVTEIDFQDGPYLAENNTATTLAPSAVSGAVTLTASAVTGINDDQGFLVTDVGRLVRLIDSNGMWHWYKITGFTSTTVVDADYKGGWNTTTDAPLTARPNTTANAGWRMGAWSETTGWPARVSFQGERLTWARTNTQPQTVWFSRAGDFERHRPGVLDDDAITITILSGQVNEVTWLAEASALQIGTTGATRTIGAANQDNDLAPTNIRQKRHTTYKSLPVQPTQVGEVTLFVGAFGRSIREFVFSFEVDGFVAPDISILSSHIFREGGGVVEMAYQQDPDAINWIVFTNGTLCAMTYERDQKTVAFAPQVIAGGDADDFGIVESAAVIPGDLNDEVWIIVKRTIDGSTVRYVEQLQRVFEEQDAEDAFFVDGGLTYDGAATDTISGLDHLEGEEVAIYGDGAVLESQVVSGGSITLEVEVEKAQIGKGYASTMTTMPLITARQDGSMLGRRRKTHGMDIDVLRTQLISAKAGQNTASKALYREVSDPLGEAQGLRTGVYRVPVDSSWSDDGSVTITVDTPTPATVLSVSPAMEMEP